jgi:GH35 family endo-1,4-beta-xylanase
MWRRVIVSLPVALAAMLCGESCWAIINGNALALNSGAISGNSALFGNDGYAGTYINVTTPGDVTVTVNASGTVTSPGDTVHMNIALADTKAGFDFSPIAANNYSNTFHNVPVGTYFIRNEYTDDRGNPSRGLKINSLDITSPASNAATFTINNATDSASLSNNALAAADTYIKNSRRGSATIALANAIPGTQVHLKLASHAFNFGVNVPGSTASTIATYLGTPTPGSTADNFQQFLKSHYINTLVPSNYGKWANTEAAQNAPTMDRVDTLLNFAQANNMRTRMHALMWGDQNPTWVVNTATSPPIGTGVLATAVTNAPNGNTVPYTNAVSNRIDYYVGTGAATDRAKKYIELDVHNEELHRIGPWNALRAGGEAKIFKEVKDTVAASGAKTKLYVNEYNVLQNSPGAINIPVPGSDPYTGVVTGLDPYANWYRQNIDEIQNAAIADPNIGAPVVSGVGSQYYVVNGHSSDTMMKALQNLAVTGLPMSLTEFGIQGSVSNTATAANYMEEAMKMVFGNPDAQTFMYWGFWGGATDPNLQGGGVLVNTTWKNADGTWNLTPVGNRYEWLFGINPDATKGGANSSPWTTDETLTVGPDGTIDLSNALTDTRGFYGDYTLTVDGKTVPFSLIKGTTSYSLTISVGDYNNDGKVDAADYTVWRDTLGSTTDLRADGNNDGMIDAPDYDAWVARYGNVYASGAGADGLGAAVPEPSSISLPLAGLFALVVLRTSSRAKRDS